MTQTVLVTGGSRGIGEAIARRFGADGCRVILTCRTELDKAKAVAEQIGHGSFAVQSDCSQEDDILALFQRLDQDGIVLDALVNNAGITGPKRKLVDVTAETLREVSETNWIGLVLMCREAVKRMSTQNGGAGGSIVNISSTATRTASPNQWVDYAALKGAIDVLTNGLAREVGAEGIRVNAVAPGYVLTDPDREEEIVGRFESMKHEVPMARIGEVEEIANAVAWLCSDEAAYVTGMVMPVAGGR